MGETLIETFTITVNDNEGDTSSQIVTVTINGTNDAAVLSSATVALDENNSPLTTSGTLTISDVDSPETFVAQTNTAGTNGSFSITSAGVWSYTANSAFDSLNVGQSVSDTFSVAAADGTTTSVKVTINGTNDAAVITGDTSGNVTEDGTLTASGSLRVSDVDAGQSSFVSTSPLNGNYGTFKFEQATGDFFYFNANQSNWTLTSGGGSSPAPPAEVAFGENPSSNITIKSSGEGEDTWASAASDQDYTISFSYHFESIDGDPSAYYQIGSKKVFLSGSGTVTANLLAGQAITFGVINGDGFGDLTISAFDATPVSGTWTYTLANGNTAVQALGAGEILTDSLTVTSVDGTTQIVTITVTGTNDLPVISFASGNAAGSVTEDTTLSATGTLTSSDIDNGATATWSIASSSTGTYGALALDGNTGTWTYTLANGTNGTSSVVQNLAAGESVTDSFTVRVTDDKGGVDDQLVTVTINGTNDVPTVTNGAGALAGSVTEAGANDDGTAVAGTSTASGTLIATDVDANATQTWTIEVSPSTTYGSIAINPTTGVCTYTLDNSLAATQALKEGEVVTQTYTARVTDDKGAVVDQTVTVTINGTNDAPTVAAALSQSADDGAASFTLNLLSGASDLDSG